MNIAIQNWHLNHALLVIVIDMGRWRICYGISFCIILSVDDSSCDGPV